MAFKIFPKVKRLPTLFGILILVVGIAATAYLTQRVQLFFLKAQPKVIPQNVKISNLTRETFTASWITLGNPSSGYLKFGKTTSLGKISLDDRDQNINALGQYVTHHVTVGGLEPQTTYYFKIVSGGKEYDQNGSPYSTTTASANPSSSLNPTYGIILEENNQPAKEGIVYVRLGNSNLASTLIKSSGNWLVPLAGLLNQDLKSAFKGGPEDLEEIFVQGNQKTSKAMTTLQNNAPVPEIVLGKDYDFRTLPVSPTPPKPTLTPTPLSFSLTQPASGAAIPGQPLLKGTGIPGEKVKIKLESESPLTAEVTIDQSGNWLWQPPQDLSPGEHTATVTSLDNQSKPQTIVRKFMVLASGTQVVEAATPSATPTVTSRPSPTSTPTPTPTAGPKPTLTPTPTSQPSPTPSPTMAPKPTLSPTPQATSAAFPESGDLLLTLLLGAAGITFIGLSFLFKPGRVEAS